MTFDVVILAYSRTEEHRKITEDCIKSLKNAKNKIDVNIIVLESFDKRAKFEGVTNVFFSEAKFCYNNSMNEGFKYTTADYVFFCNNDLFFYDGWADSCYNVFHMGYKSLSPFCPSSHNRFNVIQGNYLLEGYQVGFHVAGWCIGVERKMFEDLGGFNTAVDFWYSDNLYAEQLKIAKVKHALVCNAVVRHLDAGSKTLKSMTAQKKKFLTSRQGIKYKNEVRRLWNGAKETVLRKH